MKCMYGQGQMKRGVAPFHVDRKGYHLTFDEVPSCVCSQCGEAYFEESEVEAIQQTLVILDQQTQKMTPGLDTAPGMVTMCIPTERWPVFSRFRKKGGGPL